METPMIRLAPIEEIFDKFSPPPTTLGFENDHSSMSSSPPPQNEEEDLYRDIVNTLTDICAGVVGANESYVEYCQRSKLLDGYLDFYEDETYASTFLDQIWHGTKSTTATMMRIDDKIFLAHPFDLALVEFDDEDDGGDARLSTIKNWLMDSSRLYLGRIMLEQICRGTVSPEMWKFFKKIYKSF